MKFLKTAVKSGEDQFSVSALATNGKKFPAYKKGALKKPTVPIANPR
jgi:hypothetical protein